MFGVTRSVSSWLHRTGAMCAEKPMKLPKIRSFAHAARLRPRWVRALLRQRSDTQMPRRQADFEQESKVGAGDEDHRSDEEEGDESGEP